MTIYNLTPHALNIRTGLTGQSPLYDRITSEFPTRTIHSHGSARLAEDRRDIGGYNGIHLSAVSFGALDLQMQEGHLPIAGDLVVVSAIVGASPEARDAIHREWPGVTVCSPGPLVRDEAGRIIACRGLTVWHMAADTQYRGSR